MNLIQALECVRDNGARDGLPLRVFAATGFETLHLATFLQAHLAQRLAQRTIDIETGVFGDLAGNIEKAIRAEASLLAVFIEWADLDPRLGARALGGWRTAGLADILDQATANAGHLVSLLTRAAETRALVVSLPTLLPAPVFFQRPGHIGAEEAVLRRLAAEKGAALAALPHCIVLDAMRLTIGPQDRHDVKSDLMSGFPYDLAHASDLAAAAAAAISPIAAKKGLITDLDNTVWKGVLGDDGVDAIGWGLDGAAQSHGLYQQLLAGLSDAGVLIAVASKNDAGIAEQALARDDILFPREAAFPFEVHWQPKSVSVARILKTWNIAAADVVFVDDSEMELEEVQTAFPEMTCARFPAGDDRAAWKLLTQLREMFGRTHIQDVDTLRAASLRTSGAILEVASLDAEQRESLLKGLKPHLRLDWSADKSDTRSFELLNKTNQFSLNGARYGHGDWLQFLDDPGNFLLSVRYKDKFGELGKIAVLGGGASDDGVVLKFWVMSCRAFGRRIEHACLKALFDRFDPSDIDCESIATERNQPMQDFLETVVDHDGSKPILRRARFQEMCPPLYCSVETDDRP